MPTLAFSPGAHYLPRLIRWTPPFQINRWEQVSKSGLSARAVGGCISVFRTEHKIAPRRWTVQTPLPGLATRGSWRNMGTAPPCNSISKQGLRKPMITNQFSLPRTAIATVTQFRQHLVGRPAGVGLMPCVFASLRFNGLGSNAETPRRKDAERTWPRGG